MLPTRLFLNLMSRNERFRKGFGPMLKQTFATLFLCTCFGAFSCTDSSSTYFEASDDTTPGAGTLVASDNGDPLANPLTQPDAGGIADTDPAGEPNDPPEPVPEPMTMLLFGSGLAGVAYRYRRRKGQAEGEEATEV